MRILFRKRTPRPCGCTTAAAETPAPYAVDAVRTLLVDVDNLLAALHAARDTSYDDHMNDLLTLRKKVSYTIDYRRVGAEIDTHFQRADTAAPVR